jgi:3-oxoacyl-(acyl-carrier-protein) synthase III
MPGRLRVLRGARTSYAVSSTRASPAFSIAGSGLHVPDRIITNDELAAELRIPGIDAPWIEQRTGIRERRWVRAGESTGDLAARAAKAALEDARCSATDIDVVIVATSTPDWPQPHTAARVHGMLGMRPDAGAFDVNAVCSGWIDALVTGGALLATRPEWTRLLVVGADCYSRITNPEDHRTRVLFGDGAGAVVIDRSSNAERGIHGVYTHTNFADHEALIVRGGGARLPLTPELLASGAHWFSMDGPAVRQFGSSELARAMSSLAAKRDDERPDAPWDAVIPHQSNRRMLEAACATAGIDDHLLITTIEQFGNTAAASIPITLAWARTAGHVATGDWVCLVGYGGGLSVAGVALRL